MTATEFVERDLPKPGYEILKTEELPNKDGSRTLTHVKLSKPHVARKIGLSDYVELEYVKIGIVSLDKEDKDGKFHYEETTVIGSDVDGDVHEVILYLAPRALSVEEALFAIGEI